LILTKNELGNNLGDFLTNPSGHTGSRPLRQWAIFKRVFKPVEKIHALPYEDGA
jgi:hypothetical protein